MRRKKSSIEPVRPASGAFQAECQFPKLGHRDQALIPFDWRTAYATRSVRELRLAKARWNAIDQCAIN